MSRNRTCSKNGCENNQATSHAYCNKCHAANMREWRKTHPLTAAQRVKDNVRTLARHAEKRGEIKRKVCEVCGFKDTERHHDNYSKPLEVRYLCRKHHLEWHATHHVEQPNGT